MVRWKLANSAHSLRRASKGERNYAPVSSMHPGSLPRPSEVADRVDLSPRGRVVPGAGRATGPESEVLAVELVLDAVLHDIFYDGGPTTHLIGLLGDSLLASDGVHFLTVTLRKEKNESEGPSRGGKIARRNSRQRRRLSRGSPC